MFRAPYIRRPFRRAGTLALAAGLALAAFAPAADAQYFGRQKVQYRTFDFRIMQTEHFDVYFYPPADAAIRDAARMSERWYSRLGSILRHELPRQPVIYYSDHADFQQTNVVGGMIDQAVGGLTEGMKNRVVLPLTGIYESTDHVIGHELVHAFQYDIAQQRGGGGLQGMSQLPLWLIEGMAEYLAIGRNDPHTAMWMRDAALREDLPTIRQLTRDPRYFPYRYGQALWAYIGGRWGDDVIPTLYRAATRVGFEAALRSVLGMGSDSLSAQWIDAISATYTPLMAGRSAPAATGRRVIGDPSEPGDMNISPVVSPDGRYVAFYGRRQLFTVDLYLADARTGEIIRTLASPQADEHFDAISFLHSAGTWSPDGSQFAFVVFADGVNQIAILDVASRDVVRRIRVAGVTGITDPAWSPEGGRIAFSGRSDGLSDLYVLDLASGEARRLTSDRHADIQPSWSPNGRTIVFASDRGPGTDFQRLVYSPMQLSLIDVQTGAVSVLPGFPGAKHIDPRFSADGADVFFVSDREGFSDIYRLSIATGEYFQVTRVATGVSGITHLSPAISIAGNGQLMFSVFENAGQSIHALEPGQTRGTPVSPAAPAIAVAGLVPPVEVLGTSTVERYLAEATIGLPPTGDFPVRPYRPGLSLDFIGGPTIGAATGPFGTMVGGGVAFFFSDMLGDRNLMATVQASGEIQDIGGELMYVNLRRRWNWGVGAAHVPFLSGFTGVQATEFQGQPAREFFTVLQRVYVDEVSGITHFPFSPTRRFEARAGLTRLGYDFRVDRVIVVGNTVVDRQRDEIPSPDALYYAQSSVALVGDNSFSAFTSPVSGGRYRFEASPTYGTLQFFTVLGDWRRYLFVSPLTLAVRGLHYGRHGRDGEDPRLTPIYLGMQSLVRGYAVESFDVTECTEVPDDPGACPEFDRLIGSRIAVASAELRIPLFGTAQFGLIDFSFLPTEIAPFVDAGLAWGRGDSPELRFDRATTDRVPVVSAGVTSRVNILGYLVLEIYYAHPFQRARGGHFGFNLAPGW
ncbi:MAG TPA: BamA/TamA family outer membrane protein [Gemmatimonadaceae bacterium]|nr:BamA/TamA family outer membrane protein [Gemmatimonadaceae bacterium]